ncbi:50S ribosomal protein L16 [Candidatus Woesebacteria bacterium RIFCSPHIGHO2_01_FULL_37_10]|uniref:Large ribosomal subunit protein uL16 n=2 Tax=Candidatus Woeseibacteriota TaxID=1752722 RepID=A0A1F7XUL3_9BACT|nr:MAG: 50S ribosomal protein L16 [Candidatus Woesebacteria bacterium RIFCSPHIGHO2_01_FULL_37_10]
MLEPKRTKFRKAFRGKMRGKAMRGSSLSFGEYGLKALERGWLSSRQIEAGRRVITHSAKRGGKVWIRVFPDKPVTGRPAGQRMGSGKGDVEKYVSVVTPGRIIYEIAGIADHFAQEALRKAGAKMPFKTRIVTKEE